MDTFYWVLQYIWVIISIIFIMFIWPSVVFKKHLKNKSRTYRFAFCAVIMILIIYLICIILGLLGILYQWLYSLLFYGTFLFFLFKDKRISDLTKKRFKNFIAGTYGPRSLFSDLFSFIGRKIKETFKSFLLFMKGRWFDYIALSIIVLFGLFYYSCTGLQDYSLGCPDMPVHYQWTYYLTEGTIFYSGIYPQGMHMFLCFQSVLFNIPLYSVMAFGGCAMTFVTFISAVILFKECFKWKYSAYIALLLFLILDLNEFEVIVGVCRMQWALPLEFAFSQTLLCAAFLTRFLKSSIPLGKKALEKAKESGVVVPQGKKKRFKLPLCIKDENLFIFTLALADTIIIHFYATILAFFLCFGVAMVLFVKVFSRKFVPLLGAIGMGLFLSVGPMAVCFLCGIHLQGSLYWALSLFIPQSESVTLEEGEDITSILDVDTGTNAYVTDYLSSDDIGGRYSQEVLEDSDFSEQPAGILETIKNKWEVIKKTGYETMHDYRKDSVLICSALAIVIWLVSSLTGVIYRHVKHIENDGRMDFSGYAIISMMSFWIVFCYSMHMLGLPIIIEPYRVCTFAIMMGTATLLVPVDFVLHIILSKINEKVSWAVATVLLAGSYIFVRTQGMFHGYLAYQVTRYNSTVMVTEKIVKTMPKDSYTIVSSTDELYQIIGHGYHEELIQFINESEEVSYTLPTNYIFIYIEKHPVYRNHYNICDGPSWLADVDRYVLGSIGLDFSKSNISESMANVYFGKLPLSIDVYGIQWQKILLNSKMYVWCQKFNAMYPNELHIYYEDDDFLCYYLKQNPRNLYELAAMDPSVMIPPEEYDNPIWPVNYWDQLANPSE